MASAGERQVEALARDVLCPACEYNLRGLRGAVVDCPECGHRCDIAELVTQKWTEPWHKAPGLNRVLLPVVWAVLAPMIAMLLGVMMWRTGSGGVVWPLLMLVVIGGWLLLMRLAWLLFDSIEGVWLALLAHAVMAGYLVGVNGGIVSMILLIGAVVEDPWWDVVIQSVLVLMCGVVVVVSRRGERWIAGRCIRRYLTKRCGGEVVGA